MTTDGLVSEIWRYPVKSMLGEALAGAEVDARGLVGDRRFAVCDADGKLGSGKNTRRMRRMEGLFGFAAVTDGDGAVRVTTPGGRVLPAGEPELDGVLSEVLGITVHVQAEGRISHFDDSPVHLVTRAALDRLRADLPGSLVDARRFRANLVLDLPRDEGDEASWVGRTLSVGPSVVLRVTAPTGRCVMTTMAQAELPDDPEVLRRLAREADACFGFYAEVVRTGRIAGGDAVRLGTG